MPVHDVQADCRRTQRRDMIHVFNTQSVSSTDTPDPLAASHGRTYGTYTCTCFGRDAARDTISIEETSTGIKMVRTEAMRQRYQTYVDAQCHGHAICEFGWVSPATRMRPSLRGPARVASNAHTPPDEGQGEDGRQPCGRCVETDDGHLGPKRKRYDIGYQDGRNNSALARGRYLFLWRDCSTQLFDNMDTCFWRLCRRARGPHTVSGVGIHTARRRTNERLTLYDRPWPRSSVHYLLGRFCRKDGHIFFWTWQNGCCWAKIRHAPSRCVESQLRATQRRTNRAPRGRDHGVRATHGKHKGRRDGERGKWASNEPGHGVFGGDFARNGFGPRRRRGGIVESALFSAISAAPSSVKAYTDRSLTMLTSTSQGAGRSGTCTILSMRTSSRSDDVRRKASRSTRHPLLCTTVLKDVAGEARSYHLDAGAGRFPCSLGQRGPVG